MSIAQLFFPASYVPRREHSNRGNHGNQGVIHKWYYVQGDTHCPIDLTFI